MRLIKSSFACLLFSFVIVGCGGGPKPPIPSSNGQPTAFLTANPTRVRSGETVLLRLSVSPEPLTVSWTQEPEEPRGEFQTALSAWIAPTVSGITRFSIVARVNFSEGVVLTPSVSIVVSPKEEESPSVIPPRVAIYYPLGPPYNVVANGECILQVLAKVWAGTNPVVKLEVLVDGRVVETLLNPPFDVFRIDVHDFGLPGVKNLILRATDNYGVYGEASIELRHDPVELEKLAKEFLRKYNPAMLRFITSQIPVWVSSPELEQFVSVFQDACAFWKRYTLGAINLYVVTKEPDNNYYIEVVVSERDSPYAAEAFRRYGEGNTIIGGLIFLYRGWVSASESYKILALAHEIGHILLTEQHTTDGSFMDAPHGYIFILTHRLRFGIYILIVIQVTYYDSKRSRGNT